MTERRAMISVELALALRAAGLSWTPQPGDRFVLPHRGMDAEVFVLSDMTVEVHDFPSGPVIGFNGVTEWALDSVQADEALWLPAEGQLRDLLGTLFRRLTALPSPDGAASFETTVTVGGEDCSFTAGDAVHAYGRALLAVLTDLRGDPA